MTDDPAPAAGHSVPLLEGRESRRHHQRTITELRADAGAYAASAGAPSLSAVRTLVQFAGFPRSGHSLVGSLIDAHPEAAVAHELDLMGLLTSATPGGPGGPGDPDGLGGADGLGREELFALVCRASAEFEAHGRWWNGYCYRVEGGSGGVSARPRVLGDKKADWAVRRTAADPGLLEVLQRLLGEVRAAWVVVVRNPFDNVATMSLRKGRRYDRIRINTTSPSQFQRRLEQQQGSTIAAEALEEMVDDYAGLCAGVAAMKRRVAPKDWLEVRHEDLVADPETAMRRIFTFLDLPLEPPPGTGQDGAGLLAGCAAAVAAQVNRTRHQVSWSTQTRARVEELTGEHSFLEGYHFDD